MGKMIFGGKTTRAKVETLWLSTKNEEVGQPLILGGRNKVLLCGMALTLIRLEISGRVPRFMQKLVLAHGSMYIILYS